METLIDDDTPRSLLKRLGGSFGRAARGLATFYEVYHASGRNLRRSRAELRRRDPTPIVVGPWLSEVGFELLYWIPFLERMLGEADVDPARVIVLSRGDVSGWYARVARHQVDLFDLWSPSEYAERLVERERVEGVKKQMSIFDFERELAARAARERGLDEFVLLHPSVMYRFFGGYWRGRHSLDRVRAHCLHQPFAHRYPRPAALPFDESYVTVKLYHSESFPACPENTAFAHRLTERLAARGRVVVLNTGLALDDHAEAEAVRHERIFDASTLLTARDNLAVQSALVAHSDVLYCTYGGFSYLGFYVDTPTVSFFSDPTIVGAHLPLATTVLNPPGSTRFTALATGTVDTLF